MTTSGMNRKTLLKRAGVGSLAAASFPAAFGTGAAFGGDLPPNGHRIGEFVAFSQAPGPRTGPVGTLALPRIGMNGAVTFDAHAGWVKGGGGYELFDQAAALPKPLKLTGQWEAAGFVDYSTKNVTTHAQLNPYGLIQPGILTLKADLENFASGLTMMLVCNVGALGAPGGGLTGMDEGWFLENTPYGDFEPAGVGITHLSVEGISLMRG
jgi:hypothetical protein